MQRTADFHHKIADARLPEAAGVVDDATAFDAAVDVLDARVRGRPHGFRVGMSISTRSSVNARKRRSWSNRLPAGKGYGVASAIRLSWVLPAYVSLRKRIVSAALISRTFFTVWHVV